MQYETSIQITAAAEKVWAEMIDVERWPEWSPTMTRIARLDNGPFQEGSQARVEQPKLRPMIWTVTQLNPGREFTWVARTIGVVSEGRHRLDPQVDGTATVTLGVRQTGPLAWLVSLFYSGLTRRYVDMEADGLKRRCEAAS